MRYMQLGWRDQVLIVDDNFIGNHKLALELALKLEEWQIVSSLSDVALHRGIN